MKPVIDALLASALVLSTAGMALPEDLPLDVSGVLRVEVKGAASAVRLTTSDRGPYQATVDGRGKGWFSRWHSSWFSDDCSTAADMRIEGSTLVVRTPSPGWFDNADCTVDVTATLKPGAAVAIAQAASEARLSGDFSSVAIDGAAADVDLSGHASDVTVSGDALRLHFAYAHIDHVEAVRIKGRMVEADLDFGGVPEIDYAVEATASWINRVPKSVPGIRPLLRISGDFIHATVR